MPSVCKDNRAKCTNKQTNKKRVEFLGKITQHLQREMDEFLDKITQHLQLLLAYLQLKKLTRKQLALDFCVF
jgi:CBS-domain-containing membrane protein